MNPAPHPMAPLAAPWVARVFWYLRLLGDVVRSGAHGLPQRLPGRAATALLARLALAPPLAQAARHALQGGGP